MTSSANPTLGRIQATLKSISVDSLTSVVFVLVFCDKAITAALNIVLSRFGISSGFVEASLMICIVGLILTHAITSSRALKPYAITVGVIAFVSLCFLITYALHPEYGLYYNRPAFGIWDEVYSPLGGCTFAFASVVLCKTGERVYKCLKAVGWINLLYCLYMSVRASSMGYWESIGATGQIERLSYNMDIGYLYMSVCILFLVRFYVERKPWQLLPMMGSLVAVVACGSRGALICLFVGLALVVIAGRPKKGALLRRIMVLAAICIAGMLAYEYFDEILTFAANVFSSIGLDSRTISSLKTGTIADDNGRSVIANLAMQCIRDGGFFGGGPYADRPYIAPFFYWGYSHNIVLELIADFGPLLGIAAFVAIGIACVWLFLTARSNVDMALFIFAFAMSAKLMVSGTFWGDQYFWMLVALIFLRTLNARAGCVQSEDDAVLFGSKKAFRRRKPTL